MRISLNELVQEMENKGYRITPHGVKYYTRKGLLPKPIKQGGYGKGVHLVFPDKDDVLARLYKIFEMKGKGFRLSEILRAIRNEDQLKLEYRRKKYLENFIEKDGEFFHVLEEEPDERWIENLNYVIQDHNMVDVYLYRTSLFKNDPDEVTKRKLYRPSHIYDGKIIYLHDDIHEAFAWIKLCRDHNIGWYVLEAINKRHEENFDKHFFWPNPDVARFTKAYIGWRRQVELNYFGVLLKEYIERIIEKTRTQVDLKFDFMGEVQTSWNYQYDSVDILTQDLIEEKCAFVPSSDVDIRYFLKRF